MQKLTEKSVLLLRIMFSEPEIMKELIDGKDSSYFSRLDIDADTGTMVLGKTRFAWWNDLTGDKKTISLEEFAFKAIGFLGSKAKNEGHGNKVTVGLLEDITDALHREGRSNDVIDRLFLVGYLGVKTTWSCLSMSSQETHGESEPSNVNLNIHVNEERRRFVLPGSGDEFVELTIGPKGVRLIGD